MKLGDMLLDLVKYNPYHDSKGRFTSAGGAGFVSIGAKARPIIERDLAAGKQIGAHPAVNYADKNKRLNEIIDFENDDFKTIEEAFGVRYGIKFVDDNLNEGAVKINLDDKSESALNFRMWMSSSSEILDDLPDNVSEKIKKCSVKIDKKDSVLGHRAYLHDEYAIHTGEPSSVIYLNTGQSRSSIISDAKSQMVPRDGKPNTVSSYAFSKHNSDDLLVKEYRKQVFVHELGHALTTQEDRGNYYKKYKLTKKSPSYYGDTNLSEGVAEIFALKYGGSGVKLKGNVKKYIEDFSNPSIVKVPEKPDWI